MQPKTFRIILFVGVPLAVCCWLFFLYAACGLSFENAKFKAMLFTIVFVLLFQFVIADPIKFVIQALWQTFLQKDKKGNIFRYGIPRAIIQKDDIRFFQMRVNWNKSRLTYDWRHRDEALNLFYKNVTTDFSVFGRYFIMLIVLIIILNEPLTMYHSDGLRKIFSVGTTSGRELEIFEGIENLYTFIQTNVIDQFNKTRDFDSPAPQHNFVPDLANRLLGVVRLEQARLKYRLLGQSQYEFQHQDFSPGWMPYVDYPYQKRFWRTYEPWKTWDYTAYLHYKNEGHFSKYSADQNYVVMLSRYPRTNEKIITYLKEQHWMDRLTAALFIDFTVYNADVNLFSLCRITAEHTPFGSILIHLNFASANFLLNWNDTSNWYWLSLLFYILQLIRLIQILVLKVWYGSIGPLISFWNFLDAFIVVANILVFVFVYLREETVIDLVRQFELISKEQHVSFFTAYVYGRLVDIFLSLLVFCATIRIWKVLMFARVFRLYIRTLQLGATDIFWALVNIMIFLVGLMISSHMINGSARTESHAPLSLVHILSFSLGYSERVNPMESTQGKTSALGLIIYALMMFGVTLVLLNMLITLICIHYNQAKEEERQRPKPKITYWQFLYVEYSGTLQFFIKLKHKIQRKLKNTWVHRLKNKLFKVEQTVGLKMHLHNAQSSGKAEQQATRLRRIRIMTDILLTQMEILHRRLKELNIDIDSVPKQT